MDRARAESMLRERLAREPDVVAAWLFGSVARGTGGAASDVDLAVLFLGERSADAVLDLEAELGKLLRTDVQLVVARGAPADLFHRVLRDCRVVAERDRAARLAFEVEMRNRYFDMRHVWLEYRRARSTT